MGPPNFGVKLARPASARQPSCLLHRERDGVTAVAYRDSVLCTSFAATAAPLWLRHAGPAVQLTPETLGGRRSFSVSPRAELCCCRLGVCVECRVVYGRTAVPGGIPNLGTSGRHPPRTLALWALHCVFAFMRPRVTFIRLRATFIRLRVTFIRLRVTFIRPRSPIHPTAGHFHPTASRFHPTSGRAIDRARSTWTSPFRKNAAISRPRLPSCGDAFQFVC
jgi:hypothetical protein